MAQKIREITAAVTGEPTDEQYWHILRAAISNSSYEAAKEYAALPPVLQKWAGSPSTLRDLARKQEEKTLDTVIKGQFMKQLPAMKERQRFTESLPEAVRQVVGELYTPVSPVAELTDGEYNARRNAVLDALGP